MGETIPTWKPPCNSSASVQLCSHQAISDGSALLLRKVLSRSGVVGRLNRQLFDPQNPTRAALSFTENLKLERTCPLAQHLEANFA